MGKTVKGKLMLLSFVAALITIVTVAIDYGFKHHLQQEALLTSKMESDLTKLVDIRMQSRLFQETRQIETIDKALTDLAAITATPASPELKNYKDALSQMRANVFLLGVDHNSGLQGELRGAIHKVESILTDVDNETLSLRMLMLLVQ